MINYLKKIYYEKYSKKSYSLSNVDLVIERIFKKKKKGIFIDVGCNHPIKYNNTYLLYKKGWSGINIDLDKESIKQFNELRTRDDNIQTLVTSFDNEEKDIYFYHDRSAINTIKNSKIDLMSIDIVNYEFDALKNFNFNKYNIDIIVTEITDVNIKNLETYNLSLENIIKSNLYKLLISNSYKLINWVNADLIFARFK